MDIIRSDPQPAEKLHLLRPFARWLCSSAEHTVRTVGPPTNGSQKTAGSAAQKRVQC